MPSSYSLFHPGPRPFLPITSHPLKAEIDERLFELRHPVTAVQRWLSEASEVPVTYSMLNRYKKWVTEEQEDAVDDVRLRELQKDLAFLDRIIRLGAATLDEGLCVRPSEALRAVELRANILQRFPDLSDEQQQKYRVALRMLVDTVTSVVSPEQRAEILRLLASKNGVDSE